MRRKLYFDTIARPQPYKISHRHTGRMRGDFSLIVELHAILRARKDFYYSSRDSGASLISFRLRQMTQGRVSTHGPLDVTATQCSKCAE